MGMRDKFYDPIDMGIREKDTVIRVGFFGDSFTFGQGIERIEDRYTEVVCKNLNEKFQVEVRCYNVALTGATTRDEWNLIANEAENLPPFDIVIVQFFANDIEGHSSYEEHLQADTTYGRMLRRMRTYPDNPLFSFLLRNSYAVEFLYFQQRKQPTPDSPSYIQIVKENYENEAYWKDLTLQFDKIKQLGIEREIPTGIILFPAMESVNEDYQLHFVHEQVSKYLEKINVPHQDLHPSLQGYQAQDLVANSFDPHPNEKAHQLVSGKVQELTEKLLKEKAAAATGSAQHKFEEFLKD